MAKQTKTKVDRKGLAELGLDRLIEILLEEAASNKALKARLETAIAGTAGPEETARVIDARLALLEKAKTSINRPRARDLTVELAGFLRTIQSELGAAHPFAAFASLMRLRGLRDNVEKRLNADSARLMNVFGDAEKAVADLVPSLSEAEQLKAVPILEQARRLDRYAEHHAFFAGLLGGLAKPAAAAWRKLLEDQVAAGDPNLTVGRLLQRLYLETGDLDGLVALEAKKPVSRQDTLLLARKLFEGGRHQEALAWLRKPMPDKRILSVNGIPIAVGPDYERAERRLLEADIHDALKDRDAAQALRWQIFLDTFDPEILRRYIARLDDFAEFDEMDRALAAVLASDRIEEALGFLIAWPKLDHAAKLVIDHARQWDGRQFELLLPAAEALEADHPLAATILYRALVDHILDHAIANAYGHAATYLRLLAGLSLRLPDDPPLIDHAAFMLGLQARHPRKHLFWQMLSKLA